MKWMHRLLAAAFFTASFDIVLNFQIGGSLRFCQILMFVVCLGSLARALQDGRLLWPRGATALSIWMLFQLLFLPLSGILSFGIEFFVLLLFTTFGIIATVQLYGLNDWIEPLMRVYLGSYVFVACFGLTQFILPLFHLPGPLVRQWISHGHIARVNGFSYEPSYFATYMLMGWIMLVDLRLSRAHITHSRFWAVSTILVTAALFLSTSKTGWVFMLLELVARFVPRLFRAVRSSVRRGRLLLRLPGRHAIAYTFGLILFILAAGYGASRAVDPTIFLAGSGLAHTPAHSLNDRSGAAWATIDAFKDSPFIGRSLGGVPVYIAARNGIIIHNVDEFRSYWGFPVLLDVLVASGIFGFIPFLFFLYANTIGAFRFARSRLPEERAKWLKALARAMIFEWLILMTDQNLLRVYLWFHIAMVSVVAYHLEFAPAPVPVPARPRRPIFVVYEESAVL